MYEMIINLVNKCNNQNDFCLFGKNAKGNDILESWDIILNQYEPHRRCND